MARFWAIHMRWVEEECFRLQQVNVGNSSSSPVSVIHIIFLHTGPHVADTKSWPCHQSKREVGYLCGLEENVCNMQRNHQFILLRFCRQQNRINHACASLLLYLLHMYSHPLQLSQYFVFYLCYASSFYIYIYISIYLFSFILIFMRKGIGFNINVLH